MTKSPSIRAESLVLKSPQELSAEADDVLEKVLVGQLRIGSSFVVYETPLLTTLSEIIYGLHKVAFYSRAEVVTLGLSGISFPVERLDEGKVRIWAGDGEVVADFVHLSTAMGEALIELMKRVRSERPDVWARQTAFYDYTELWLTRIILD